MFSLKSNLKRLFALAGIAVALSVVSCSKESGNTSGLYVPTAEDATANATLLELQQGRVVYIENCGSCHSLYSPDDYSTSQWPGIMNDMAPEAGLSSSDKALALKYVKKGK